MPSPVALRQHSKLDPVKSHSSSRPVPSSELVSAVMKRVRTKDTTPELAWRKLLFAAGLRHRIHYTPRALPLGRSNIDIAFPRRNSPSSLMDVFGMVVRITVRFQKLIRTGGQKSCTVNMPDERVTAMLIATSCEVLRF